MPWEQFLLYHDCGIRGVTTQALPFDKLRTSFLGRDARDGARRGGSEMGNMQEMFLDLVGRH
jgi:hypothetical protein